MRRRDVLINGSLVLGSLLVFFAVIEIGLRVTGLQKVGPDPPRIYQRSTNPRISFELIPNIERTAYRNTVTTDSRGFRSRELDPEKPVIAILGDSIAFGHGIADDETLAANLQESLPTQSIVNAAVPAYQLLQETAVYETKIRPLDPAGIILVFYWNDFTEETAILDDQGILRPEGWTPQENICVPSQKGPLRFVPGQCWLKEHSAFYKAFEKLINVRYGNEQLAQARKESQEHPENDSVTDADLALYEKQLKSFRTIPPKTMPRLFVIWPDRYLHTRSLPKLKAIATREGFTVVDLYETFGNEVPTLGWDTVHPNAEATEEAAKVILGILGPLLGNDQ